MKIIDISYHKDGIVRGEMEGETDIYYPTLDLEGNKAWCSCPYNFHKQVVCKHIKYFLKYINFNKARKMADEKLLTIPTDCEELDEKLDGGIPVGILTSVAGEPEVGKTMLMLQTACSAVSLTGKHAIIFETEGYREADLHRILKRVFFERFDLDEEDLDKFHFYSVSNAENLLELLGWEVEVSYKKKKMEIEFSELDGRKTKKGTDMLIPEDILEESTILMLDSFTSPVKALVADDRKNFPARAKIISKLFKILFDLCHEYNLAGMVSHHISKDPTNFRSLGEEYGGNTVKYNMKWKIALMRGVKKQEREYGSENKYRTRRFRIVRKPAMPKDDSYEKYGILLKKNWGFVS